MISQLTLDLSDLKREWIEDAANVVLSMGSGYRFTSDDLHDMLPAPACDNWYGVLMAQLRNKNLIRRVLAFPKASRRPERNGAAVNQWEVV
jgi:hypothetical protein